MIHDASVTREQRHLFWACFVALVATSFTFILRIMALEDIAAEFDLSETQKGEILGVGIWPFAVSIVLFSLVIDKIGYGKAILFAFLAHTAFAVLTVLTPASEPGSDFSYWWLYVASGLGGLAAGAIEAAINPLVATVFHREKTKWLNILHAGWPGGLVAAGVIAMLFAAEGPLAGVLGGGLGWQGKILVVFVPVVAYGLMMLRCSFPVSERVAAGVSYHAMLKEVGFLGAFIISALIFQEIGRVFAWSETVIWVVVAGVTVAFGAYVRSPGRPLFAILMLIMIPLAITELGTDSWITELMKPPMEAIGLQSGWVLVYTAALMMVLRFFAGPIVERLSPLGLLAASSALAVVGLTLMSTAAGIVILVAATVYGVGKTFFWPTMLGVVSEQFPRGGALTLNLMGGMGMLSAGVLGNALLGNIQDQEIAARIAEERPALERELLEEEQLSIFGTYRPLDDSAVQEQPEPVREYVDGVRDQAKKDALSTVALFPGIMLVAYLVLLFYFRMRGGYRPVAILGDYSEPPHPLPDADESPSPDAGDDQHR